MKTPILQFMLTRFRPAQFILSLIMFSLAILLPAAVGANAVALDRVIAVVNDEAITLSEYQVRYKRVQIETNQVVGQIPAEIAPDIMRLLVDEHIQVQAAQVAGISVAQPDVENVFGNMASQNNLSPAQLLAELESQGISEIQFKRSIAEQVLIQRMVDIAVNSKVTVSEQEVDYYLRANKERYSVDKTYEISHLYVSTEGLSESDIARELENVNHIRQGLTQGQPFDLAVENFSDEVNREQGGYLGWRTEQQLPELFINALRQTSVSDITEIIKSANGFHIIKLHNKKGKTQVVIQIRVRHILVQPQRHNLTEQEAIQMLTELADKINNEGDFEKFARLTSDDATTASVGGSLGWIGPGDMPPLFQQAAFRLPLNQLSEPVKSQFGYHLVEVLDRREKDISHDIVRNNARNELFRRKATERYRNWFDQLRDQAYIEYRE